MPGDTFDLYAVRRNRSRSLWFPPLKMTRRTARHAVCLDPLSPNRLHGGHLHFSGSFPARIPYRNFTSHERVSRMESAPLLPI